MDVLEKGSRVIITDKLKGSITQRLYKLDSNGNMLRMQGNCYTVDSIFSSTKVRVNCPHAGRNYVFHPDDVERYSKERDPIIFNFNPQLLEV